MLKITETEPVDHTLTLRLEGRIIGPWIEEVRRLCEGHLERGQAMRLDLAEVSFVERAGLGLLLSLQSRGVTLVECSAFVEEELKAAAAGLV